MIIIGSFALQHGLGKVGLKLLKRKGVSDYDFIATRTEATDFIEAAGCTVIQTGLNRVLAKAPDGKMLEFDTHSDIACSNNLYRMYLQTFRTADTVELYGIKVEIAPLEVMYSIKRAHRHSPKKFAKHVGDYNQLHQHFKGVDILDKITKVRYKETVEREKLRTPSLKKASGEFFDDNVSNKTFVHDEIHEVMAHGPRPMFEQILKEPGVSVACSREKFEALGFVDRVRCVQEEAYVIALERAVIPMLFEDGPIANPRDAYRWAVMRICTTLCSGWFREFALENYDDLIYFMDDGYVNKFLNAVENGKIERIQK